MYINLGGKQIYTFYKNIVLALEKLESVLCFVKMLKKITNFVKNLDISDAWMLKQTQLVLNFDNFDKGFIDICFELYQFELLEF